jgi:hypothetical protein
MGNGEHRGEMPWVREATSALKARVKALLGLRAARAEARRGELVWLPNDQEWAVVSFARRLGSARTLVAVNVKGQPVTVKVEAAALGASNGLDDLLDDGAGAETVAWDETAKRATLTLPAYASRAFSLK